MKYTVVDAKSREFDFSQGAYDVWEPVEIKADELDLEECIELLKYYGVDYSHVDSEDEDEVRAVLEDYLDDSDEFQPMMNFIYPLHGEFDSSDVKKLLGLPLTIVRMLDGDEYYLALTGGGMDLSWEICEAYMRLDFYPPIEFCDLPAMADRGESEHDKSIIDACKKSAEAIIERANRLRERLDNL